MPDPNPGTKRLTAIIRLYTIFIVFKDLSAAVIRNIDSIGPAYTIMIPYISCARPTSVVDAPIFWKYKGR